MQIQKIDKCMMKDRFDFGQWRNQEGGGLLTDWK